MTEYVLIHINKCAGGSIAKALSDYKDIKTSQIHMVENFYKLTELIDSDKEVIIIRNFVI